MRPPSHLCPASRINTGYSLFPHNFGIPFCDFCVTSAPSASAPACLPRNLCARPPHHHQTTTTSPHAPSQPFMPCKPHKHWLQPFSTQFWYSLLRLLRNLRALCVRPAFLPPTFRTSFFTQHTHARFATTIISPCLPHLTVPPFGALSPPCFVALMARWRLPCLCSWP